MMVGKVTKVLIVPLCYGRYKQHTGTLKKNFFLFLRYFYYKYHIFFHVCIDPALLYAIINLSYLYYIKKKKGKIFFLSFLGIRKKCDRPISLRENRLIFLLQLRIDMLNNQI